MMGMILFKKAEYQQAKMFKSANMFIDNIFSWRPSDDQWWITGFNPEYKGEKADAKNQIMIGSVDFSGHGEMYDSFKIKYKYDQKFNRFIVYDDNNKTIWLCWCEGDLI